MSTQGASSQPGGVNPAAPVAPVSAGSPQPAPPGPGAASPQAAGGWPPPAAPPITAARAAAPQPAAAVSATTYRPARPLAFFLWMSKTDIQAIGHCTYEAVATQAALGAMVLLSGLFAFSSSFFLVYSISEGQLAAAWLAPFIYAAAILVFDRELVGFTPASELSAWGKFLHLFPRLVFACLIGYAIAIPMEHKLMERAIEEEIAQDVVRNSTAVVQRSNAARAEVDTLRQQLVKDLDDARGRLRAIETRLNEEYMRRGGKGPVYAGLEDERNRQMVTVLQAQERLANFRPTAAQEAAMQEADKVIEERIRSVRKDILKRTEALQRIRDRNAAADLLSRVVVAVFVLLELFPMVLKLFQRYNEYHAYLEVRRRMAIQKNHVLGNHALEFIDKYPAEAAKMELTDIIQSGGEDPVLDHSKPTDASTRPPLAGANPYMQMLSGSSGRVAGPPATP